MEKFALPHCHGEGQREEYLRDQLGRPDTFQNVADTFRLLDDTSRVRIFWLLCHCEECVINISAMVDMTSPAVSHHLRQLKAGGLIVSRRRFITGRRTRKRAGCCTRPLSRSWRFPVL